jgi:hypothetical protein
LADANFGAIVGEKFEVVSHSAQNRAQREINGQQQYLWRAVDQNGDVIHILVQPRRDQRAAERFFRRLLRGQGKEPLRIVTDKLKSYSNEDFVQVANVAESALTTFQFSGIVGTELLTPDSNGFIRDDHSAFGEKILDIPEAQAETMVNPDSIADNF